MLSLSPAPIASVAPEISYRGSIALQPVASATMAGKPPCGIASGLALTGSVTITKVQVANLVASLWPVRLAFQMTVGVSTQAGWSSSGGATCEWSLGPPPWVGVIPGLGLPVFAQPKLTLEGSLSVATSNGYEASADLVSAFDTSPARVSLALASGAAHLTGQTSSPRGEVSAGVALEVGIGVPDIDSIPVALNVHATLGAAVAFTAEPSATNINQRCLFHVRLGSLEIGLTGGPFALRLAGFAGLDQRIYGWNCGSGSSGGGGGGGGGGAGGGSGGGGGTGSPARMISAGGAGACALLSGGSVECWGRNDYDELGDGTTTGPENCQVEGFPHACSRTPVPVSGTTNVTAVSSGDLRACALLSGGSIECWGENSGGQLGDGTFTTSSPPVTVSGITNATAISAGGFSACGLLSGGSIECWGGNEFGEVGDGTTTERSTPVTVGGITNATAISAGGFGACGLLSGGSVECWGRNEIGELGNGTKTGPETCESGGFAYACSRTPVPVSGITNATAISAGNADTCALLSSGSIKCWGANESGELGDGTSNGPETCKGIASTYACSRTPVPVSGITNATAISAGNGDTCALLSSGSIKCWGRNELGELGDGTTTASDMPTSVSGITNATAISAGCALLTDGSIKCWGGNEFGALGGGTSAGPETCEAVGSAYACSRTPVAVSGIP